MLNLHVLIMLVCKCQKIWAKANAYIAIDCEISLEYYQLRLPRRADYTSYHDTSFVASSLNDVVKKTLARMLPSHRTN